MQSNVLPQLTLKKCPVSPIATWGPIPLQTDSEAKMGHPQGQKPSFILQNLWQLQYHVGGAIRLRHFNVQTWQIKL